MTGLPQETVNDPRPHCFQVREAEDDVKLYCPQCIQSYVGDADINEIPLSAVGDTAFCAGCNCDLSNPEGYGHAGH